MGKGRGKDWILPADEDRNGGETLIRRKGEKEKEIAGKRHYIRYGRKMICQTKRGKERESGDISS